MANPQTPQVFKMKNKLEQPISKDEQELKFLMQNLKTSIYNLYGKVIQDGKMRVDGKTIDFKDVVLERKDQKDETVSDCLRIHTTQRQKSEFTEEEYTRRLASVGLVREFKPKTEKKESKSLNLEQMVLELKDKVEKQEKRIKELEEAGKRGNDPSDQTYDPSSIKPEFQKVEARTGPEQAVNIELDDQISDISVVSQDGDSSVGSDVDCLEDDLDEVMKQ